MASRPDVYKEGDVWTFRASAIGGCLRGLVAARLGLLPQPPKAYLQTALVASSKAEGVVRDGLEKRGWDVESAQDPVFIDWRDYRVTGHVDGYISAEGLARSVLEIKALGRDLFARYVKGGLDQMGMPFARMYGMQISCYMFATGLPCLVAIYGKHNEMTMERLYEEPPFSEEEVRQRIEWVLNLGAKEDWPECDSNCSSSSWYWHVHDEKPKQRVSDEDLEEKVAKAAQLKDTINALSDEHKKLTDELKFELGVGAHLLGNFSANIVQKRVPRIDLDKLRRDFGEEFLAPYQYEVNQVSLTIRDKSKRRKNAASPT